MEKLDMHSSDISQKNIERIAKLFPNCITEAKDEKGIVKKSIDFDQLRQELSDSIVEGPQERYMLNWPGKREALLTANAPVAKTLRPCREESMDFDTTENLFIEGDNLDALKLMQETYLGKIKMIYIDPPYNTGNDFVYEDDFAESTEEFLKKSNQKDGEGNRLVTNSESNGRFHSDWLSMMYPRLKLSRNLLKDDGVLFISISDQEVANLKKMCDEIFGQENFVAIITRIAKKGGNKGTYLKPKKDHVLFYFKDKLNVNPDDVGKIIEVNLEEKWIEEEFQERKRKFKKGEIPYREKLQVRPNQRYYIKAPDGSLLIPPGTIFPEKKEDGAMIKPQSEADKCWSWSRDRYLSEKENGRFLFIRSTKSPFLDENGKQAKWSVYKKIFEDEFEKRKEILTDFLDKFENSKGTREMSELKIPFDFPKPSEMIKYFAEIFSSKNSIVLDFFSGSATTAHAVMQLNAEDGGNRKFIMVQLPEPCDEKSEAFKAGYKNIAEIAKERIRRAGKKIKEESGLNAVNLDIGFRVLKVDSSNMQDVYYNPDDYSQDLLTRMTDNIKHGRSKEDLLFQILLDWGVDLSLPITKKNVAGNEVLFVSDNALAACFVNKGEITEDFCKELAKYKPLRVVFRDAGFKDDSIKINVEQIFKLKSPNTEIKTI